MPVPTRPSPSADPGLRLVRSSAAEQRLEAAAVWLRARAGRPILLLSPSRGAADHLLRRVADGGDGVFGVHRLTLRQLAADLATHTLANHTLANHTLANHSLATAGIHPVHGLALEALAARAVDVCLEREEIHYFEPVAELPGMARATLRTLLELRAAGFSADELMAGEATPDRPPVRDLGHLLAAYEESLRDAEVIDPPGVLRAAVSVCRDDAVDHDLLGLPVLLLDHTPASGAECELLAALFSRSGDVLATVIEGDDEGLAALRDRLGLAEAPRADDGGNDDRLGRLRRNVFGDGTDDSKNGGENGVANDGENDRREAETDHSFRFFAAAGEGREAVEIVRQLVQMARAGRPFDHTAIALRDPLTYQPLVEEALSRARIPAYFSRGSVRPDPAGRAFLALLACADERLSASRFAEYLSLDQAPDPADDGAPPEVEVPWIEPEGEQLVFKTLFDLPTEESQGPSQDEPDPARNRLTTPRHWERLLVDAAVIEGRQRWRRRLNGVAAELQLQLRHLDDDDETERRRIARELSRLETLRDFALPLVDDLDQLPRSAVWGDWRRALEALATRALRSPDRVLRTLTELRPMDDVGPVVLAEVRRVLETRLLELRAEPEGRRHGKVWVGTVDELRGRSFHTVFLPGLAEGRFPRRPAEDPLLLDVHRRALADAASARTLPTLDTAVESERLLLRLAVGAASHCLVTSYPSLDSLEGRPKVPSFYALDLLRAAEGRLPDLRQLERRAVAGSSSRLGWPAPIDAADAIDDAEFDLATLVDLLDRPDSDVTGRGRYLLEVNEPLRRALRHRYCRWNLRKITPADGLVAAEEDDDVRAALQAHRLEQRAYSPTALQNYSVCPLRFAYQAIFRLRPRDRPEPLEQLDPLTRGSLFHEVQFELLSALRRDDKLGLLRASANPENGEAGDQANGEDELLQELLHELLHRADQSLERVGARFEEELAPAVPRVWRAELEGLRIDLRGWLQAVRTADDGFVPERFELAFGLGDKHLRSEHHDPSSSSDEAVLADGWRLRGSIDLVERHGNGELRVTDHKTGRVPDTAQRGTRVGRGELLQPLLYAEVARQRLESPVRSGRLFYCTRRGDFRSVDVPLDENGRDSLDVVLDTIDGAVAHGALPAAPKDGACRWCDYRMICGPREESRTARKQDEMLRPLRRVRSIP